jgi:hypothetical protein
VPVTFLRGAKRLRWTEVDRLLALALSIYEDRIDPATGQDVTLSTNPALADYWTTMHPVRDYAHQALAAAQESVKDEKHPQAWRHVVGLREGWEEALAASRREGSAAE